MSGVTPIPHPSPLQNFCSSNQIAERAEECNQGHPVEYVITLLNGPQADSFITEAVVAAAGDLGYSSLKEEQLKVVTAFLEGRDVFAVLPTGYGKSLCFGCLPLAFDRLNSTRGSRLHPLSWLSLHS